MTWNDCGSIKEHLEFIDPDLSAREITQLLALAEKISPYTTSWGKKKINKQIATALCAYKATTAAKGKSFLSLDAGKEASLWQVPAGKGKSIIIAVLCGLFLAAKR